MLCPTTIYLQVLQSDRNPIKIYAPRGVFTTLCVKIEFHVHMSISGLLFTLAIFERGILIQNLCFADNVPAFKAYTVVTPSNIWIRELIVTRGMNGLCPFDCGPISQMNAITPKVLYKLLLLSIGRSWIYSINLLASQYRLNNSLEVWSSLGTQGGDFCPLLFSSVCVLCSSYGWRFWCDGGALRDSRDLCWAGNFQLLVLWVYFCCFPLWIWCFATVSCWMRQWLPGKIFLVFFAL